MSASAPYRAYRSAGQQALWNGADGDAPAAPFGGGVDQETIVGGGEASVRLYRRWLERGRADVLLRDLRERTEWIEESRLMYGRRVPVPRQQAWYGDDRAARWPADLLAIRAEIEQLAATRIHHVLLNRYRDGRDGVAWHSDHEVDHLREALIASLSLGATRAFDLRSKSARGRVIRIDLDHGDLLLMAGRTQALWEHRVAKDGRIHTDRINLTFRQS